MWIFGYGSLMWDGWERHAEFRGAYQRRITAALEGFRRTFNKASVRNWGTREHPGPTLNIEVAKGATCQGAAFEFLDAHVDAVLAYLRKREGKDFELREKKVRGPDGVALTATVPVYTGPNTVAFKNLRELAAQVRAAKGNKGTCIEYVTGVARELKRQNIEDPIVIALDRELQ